MLLAALPGMGFLLSVGLDMLPVRLGAHHASHVYAILPAVPRRLQT